MRPNQDPIYVDIGGNLGRIGAAQHQVVFGRRGSGKSCLLVHFHRRIAPGRRIFTLYLDADEIKRLGYPDVLIRLLLSITEALPGKRRGWFARLIKRKPPPLEAQAIELRKLLDLADESEVVAESKKSKGRQADFKVGEGPVNAGVGGSSTEGVSHTSKFRAEKLDTLDRHFQDYKNVISKSLGNSEYEYGAVIIDDFYLFPRDIQPDVLDYLHRLLRGTDFYLKLGTVRHRTTLMRHDGQPIGVELGQDVEEISLDHTFEDVASTQDFLGLMLDSLCREEGIDAGSEFISSDGLLHLTLASGGVPRDYLNTLVEGVTAARALGQQRVTPRTVYRGAGRLAYRTKLTQLRTDVAEDSAAIERIFGDLAVFCLKEERKTAFLVSQQDVTTHTLEHEVIQQLMDYKLIHVIESDTSAASGRAGRYEGYTLDFSLFMEPRLRGIAHVEFWKTDENRRRRSVREVPVYSLERARQTRDGGAEAPTEDMIDALEAEIGSDEVPTDATHA